MWNVSKVHKRKINPVLDISHDKKNPEKNFKIP